MVLPTALVFIPTAAVISVSKKQGKGSMQAEDQNCGEGSGNTIAGNYNTYMVVTSHMNDPFAI